MSVYGLRVDWDQWCTSSYQTQTQQPFNRSVSIALESLSPTPTSLLPRLWHSPFLFPTQSLLLSTLLSFTPPTFSSSLRHAVKSGLRSQFIVECHSQPLSKVWGQCFSHNEAQADALFGASQVKYVPRLSQTVGTYDQTSKVKGHILLLRDFNTDLWLLSIRQNTWQ